MRKGCLVAGGVAVVLIIGGSLFGLYRIVTLYWDFNSAAAELPAALKEYRANGLPFVAADVAPSHVSPDQNAAPAIRAAIKALPKKAAENALSAAFKKADPVPQALIDPFAKSLSLIEASLNRPKVDFGRDWDLGPNILFPEYSGTKVLARAAAARAVRSAAKGDDAAALKDLTLARQLSVWAGQEPTLISMLVLIADESIALNGAERCLIEVADKPERIARYQKWLAQEPPLPVYGDALRGEAFLGVTVCRNLDLYGGVRGMNAWEEGRGKEVDPSRLRRSGVPSDAKQRGFLARNLQVWNEAYRTTDGFRQPAGKIGKRLDSIVKRLDESKGLSYTLQRVLMPVFGQAGQAVTRLEARRVVQKGFAEALRVHAETGRWPEAVPQIDPFTGKPLKVKIKGKEFRVYSLGIDLKDNGGLHRREKAAKGKIVDEVAVYPPIP